MRESPGEIRIKADRFEPLFDVGACSAAAHDTVGERAFTTPLLPSVDDRRSLTRRHQDVVPPRPQSASRRR
jgi:hypothetical protein